MSPRSVTSDGSKRAWIIFLHGDEPKARAWDEGVANPSQSVGVYVYWDSPELTCTESKDKHAKMSKHV